LRWTVDTPPDLQFVRAVYAGSACDKFGMEDVLHFIKDHPEIAALNAGQIRNEGSKKSLQEDIIIKQDNKD